MGACSWRRRRFQPFCQLLYVLVHGFHLFPWLLCTIVQQVCALTESTSSTMYPKPYITHYSSFRFIFHYPNMTPIYTVYDPYITLIVVSILFPSSQCNPQYNAYINYPITTVSMSFFHVLSHLILHYRGLVILHQWESP